MKHAAIVTGDESPEDGPLGRALRARGFEAVVCPLVRAFPPHDDGPLREAVARVGEFDWVAFTSARAVAAVAELCGGSLAGLGARVACVGNATARAVEERGGTVVVLPVDVGGAGLARAMAGAADLRGRRVLYPRAESARPDLAEGLRGAGAEVVDPVAYRMEPVRDHGELAQALEAWPDAAVLLCSASAAEALAGSDVVARMAGRVIGSMGPTTSRAARAVGLEVSFEPEERSFAGLVEALEEVATDGHG
ncbi:MAG: uroporphyrinogen-III synthase [Sumerlaeia bacterium]